jgi:hypothetical protein
MENNTSTRGAGTRYTHTLWLDIYVELGLEGVPAVGAPVVKI